MDIGLFRGLHDYPDCGGCFSLSAHCDVLAGVHCRAFNVPVVPYAAVAGRLADPDADADQSLEGQAFCFLPITSTSLPIHVNGKLPQSQH